MWVVHFGIKMSVSKNILEGLFCQGLESVAVIILLCILLGLFAVRLKILDRSGSIAASVIGLIVGLSTNIFWLALLIVFLALNYMVTRTRHEYKEEKGYFREKGGIRGIDNVLANGSIPTLLALLTPFIQNPLLPLLFVSALAGITADTFASEIGVLSDRVYLITTGKKVKPGTDGGISVLGEVFCVVGSAVISSLALIFIGFFPSAGSDPCYTFSLTPFNLFLPFIVGIAICHVDSLFGATLQRRKILSNSSVNLLSVFTVIVAVWFMFLLGLF